TAYGVQISEAKVKATGDGQITIDGIGGGKAGAKEAAGVRMQLGALVESASGDIAITGIGGENASADAEGTGGNDSYGVHILGGSGVVSRGAGDIAIEGTGSLGGTNNNHGIL